MRTQLGGNHNAQPVLNFVAIAMLAGALLSWLPFEHLKAINYDIYWLVLGAKRLIHGLKMADAVYDPNPPLNFIVYLPAYLLSLHKMSADVAIIITTMGYIFISCMAVYTLARRILGRDDAAILTICFLLSSTVLCMAEFGQRDQMIVLGLLPFVLGQVILTRRIACPRSLLNIVFWTGSLLLMLRPHFGLVPAVFLVHRGMAQKTWKVARDPDCISLAICSLLYICGIWLFFPDYLTVIFPDVLKLYITTAHSMVVVAYAVILTFVYIDILFLTRYVDGETGSRRSLIRVMITCALLCLIPYLVQMKDLKYHLLPSLTFFWTALGLMIFVLLRRALPTQFPALLLIVLYAIVGYAAEPPSSYMTRIQAQTLPLTRLVANCGANCKFMLFDAVIRPTMITQYYSGKEDPSRFPSLWFLAGLRTMPAGAEHDRLFKKYAHFLAEDIDNGQPDILISCNDQFDYVGYFSRDDRFAQAFQRYIPDGRVSMDYGTYYPEAPRGLLKEYQCQLYRRGEAGR